MNIYPNPSSETLYLDTEGFELALLYDVHGKLIKKSTDMVISLKELAIGTYVIKILLENGETVSKKVIKQ